MPWRNIRRNLGREDRSRVLEISNLSSGYCPEPDSWDAVARVLDALGISHPGRFTSEIQFRKCEHCSERNVVKDGSLVCQVCGHNLPMSWNFVKGPSWD